jgi:serine/threonine-protein kinase RsbW
MDKRRILIVEDNDDTRSAFEHEFRSLGYDVQSAPDRASAVDHLDLDEFDIIVSDLRDESSEPTENRNGKLRRLVAASSSTAEEPCPTYDVVKAFRLDAVNYLREPYSDPELANLVECTLATKLRFVDSELEGLNAHEMIDLELPSDISLMNSVLQYLIARVSRLGVINPERSNLFVALDEAFVNAVKHGNRHDLTKHVRIRADLSPQEARFTVEDEGEGFNLQEIPDPCDPENLFKSSGRGVLLIYNIMDEVKYNSRGNRLTMVKRPDASLKSEFVESLAPTDTPDKPVHK